MDELFSKSYFNLQKVAKKMKGEDPCWEGYEMIGTKKGKGGKDVPNCVPKKKKTAAKEMKTEDPCWEGYEMIGTKKGKGGKDVPNCVPKKKKKTASKSFEEWANEELGEEHHEHSLEDGVMTFDEWVNDELSEPEHAKMGPGFSLHDWAREEEQEEKEHMGEEDCDECEECEECDDYSDMHDDWEDYCEECEYEQHGDEPMHGECHECEADELMSDWGDHMHMDEPAMIIMSKEAKKTPAWQRSEGKSKAGGLNEKGRKSYNRATGGNLQAPVTEKKPTGKRKKRRKSFCARMKGMKSKLTSEKTKRDPDSRINKALRRWKC